MLQIFFLSVIYILRDIKSYVYQILDHYLRSYFLNDLPWTDDAPTGSSTPIMSNQGMVTQDRIPPTLPMIIESQAEYKKQPAEKCPFIVLMAFYITNILLTESN